MLKLRDPFRFLLMTVAGWMNQHQLQVIDYVRQEIASCASNWAADGFV